MLLHYLNLELVWRGLSNRRDATRDDILPSPPGGPLHDSNGFMAPTSRAGDTRTSAGSDVQCLHVLQ